MNRLTPLATRKLTYASTRADLTFLVRHVSRMDAIQLEHVLELAKQLEHTAMHRAVLAEYKRRSWYPCVGGNDRAWECRL